MRSKRALGVMACVLAAGCAAPAAPVNSLGNMAASHSSEAVLTIVPHLVEGRAVQAVRNRKVAKDIARLDILPYVQGAGGLYSPVSSVTGQATTADDPKLLKVSYASVSDFNRPIVFSQLRANQSYRIFAQAYDAQGALISTPNSYVEVKLGGDARPSTATLLPVSLIDVVFAGRTQVTVEANASGLCDHVDTKLYTVVNGSELPITTAAKSVPMAQFPKVLTLSNLRPNTTYRLKAQAIDLSGKPIPAAAGSVDIAVTNDDAPVAASLKLTIPGTTTGGTTTTGPRITRVSPLSAGVPFPRLMGMNIAYKNFEQPAYQRDLAKLDYVILGFNKGWQSGSLGPNAIHDTVSAIRKANPKMLIGQYTILNEWKNNVTDSAWKDIAIKVTQENWWARDAAGNMVQWTPDYNAWDINFTKWSRPDSEGLRYPQWHARRDYQTYFSGSDFDIWYYDNVMFKPFVKVADFNLDGVNDNMNDATILNAYRQGHVDEWNVAKSLRPNMLHMGNVDHDLSVTEYRNKLQGAFLEGMIGLSWSLENRGWDTMMARYRGVIANTLAPHLVGFNVQGPANNYRLLRYGMTSSLMDDGYFCYTDTAKGYGGVAWFDEYDVDLGQAVDAPQKAPWQSGVYRRTFEKGMALMNPTANAVTVNVGTGYRCIAGKQDPAVNSGKPISSVTLPSKDGIILLK